ncbi:Fe3+-hydroxamate ABC transporter periplasmic protein [Natrialba taiwanensis DSM 12281]|uniref:Fe3+-hydroxamate ABC transporter periplasmic protein n=2 Tax=Natrialba taiwanensis TaxID=160846 RepID=M0AD61_9EURY|nr:Fe3+-hydroxamate ABC transporter periplasmic protein [Natrialba taiwanensis DSM 12281]
MYGGTVAVGGVLAGCTGGTGNMGDGSSDSTDSTDSYTVSMEPVGDVTFDRVPDRFVAYDGGYADMAVALGKADGLRGLGGADRYYTSVYDDVPGVDIDRSIIESHPEVRTKEEFYELNADIHLYDPEMLINWYGWNGSDVEEIASNVAPFFGNLIFRRSDSWHDYRYYTLYEAFEMIARVFQREERFEAFATLHDEFIASIRSRLPPVEDRPDVLLTFAGMEEPTTFSPYRLTDAGTSKKQWRDLGVADALAGTAIENLSTTNRGKLDYENLLEVDPDVILIRGHEQKSPTAFRDTVLAYMEDHPVGSELTAVQNGRVYRGGYLHQGPIHNLFLTERAAKQLYPDEFGDVTDETELFDRQRVSAIINGEF